MEINIIIKYDDGSVFPMQFCCREDMDDSDAVAHAELIKAYLLTKISRPDVEFKERS